MHSYLLYGFLCTFSHCSLLVAANKILHTSSLIAEGVPTPSPTTSNSTAPTNIYPWCKDVSGRFSIDSVKWIKNDKNCEWASKKSWFRCDIPEVKANCPVACDECACRDNSDRFTVDDGMKRTCKWAERKDTYWRCNKFSAVGMNCPLTCGKCASPYQFPSDSPSVVPLPTQSSQPSTSETTQDPSSAPSSESSELIPACKDVTGGFETVLEGKTVEKDCEWVQNNKAWRCNNFMNVKESCPETCGICNTHTPSSAISSVPSHAPSMVVPTPSPTTSTSTAPTNIYPWCKDVSGRFSIDSVKWIKNDKNCEWASKKSWFRCDIPEVKANCPVACDECACRDNSDRFTVDDGMKRTCKWAERKDTYWRCSHFPTVGMNCPLTCGKCASPYQFPSDSPSAAPTVVRYPTLKTTVKSTVGLSSVTVPTDETELAIFKANLIKAWETFTPEGGKVVGVEIVISGRSRVASAIFTTQLEQQCTSFSCADQQELANSFSLTQKEEAVAASNADQDINISTVLDEIFGEEQDFEIDGTITTEDITIIVEYTAPPSSQPTQIPSKAASTIPSMQPSKALSEAPSVQPSTKHSEKPTQHPTDLPTNSFTIMPTKTPTKMPTKMPTESPTKIHSTQPSIEPSLTPTIIPSSAPSVKSSSVPSVVPSVKSSSVPSSSPSLMPTSSPSVVPSFEPSVSPTRSSTKSPSGSTKSPSGSTKSPSGSTKSPSGSTKSPSGSTKSPSRCTEIPSKTSSSPSGSTKSPSGSTKSPSGSTKSPSGSTKSPSGSTKSPSGSSKSPSTCTGSTKSPAGGSTRASKRRLKPYARSNNNQLKAATSGRRLGRDAFKNRFFVRARNTRKVKDDVEMISEEK